jgi:hypothetical protein
MNLATDLQVIQASNHNKRQRIAELNEVFRAGTLPSQKLNGRTRGSVVLMDIAPGITQFMEALTGGGWMPWKGKTFDAATQTGDNLFSKQDVPIARVLWPLYRGIVADGPETVRAFKFKTYSAPGLFDPRQSVLKIDYNSPENPPLSIRRVLDEIVQIQDGVFLGKAHLKWWWGTWHTVAYFKLELQ